MLSSEIDRPAVRKRGDARRAEIVRIAGEVFLAEGYAAASMSAIAARVGGSKGTLYNHFRSKEELFEAFLREACGLEASEAFAFDPEETDTAAALRRAGGRFLRFVLSDQAAAVHRVVIAEGGRFPELGRTFYEIGPKEGLTQLSAYLDREMSSGRLRRADPQLAADHFVGLCKGGLHQRRLWGVIPQPTEAEIDAQVEAAVQVFLAAYGAAHP